MRIITITLLVLGTFSGAAPSATISTGNGITRLYGSSAELDGKLRFEKGPSWVIADGPGAASWNLIASQTGDYEISLCYAAKNDSPITVASGEHTITGMARKTKGVFGDELIDFERVRIPGSLRLSAGPNVIRFGITGGDVAVRLRSLELLPVYAKERIQASDEAAHAQRANTDWLVEAGYGVMFHWTSRSQPRHGAAKPYAAAVADFDATSFAQMVHETGAGYVLFTVNHADPHCPAPIQSWEQIHPGMTTQRDLIGDLAAELAKRKIRLMLYFASHTLGRMGKSTEDEYMDIHRQVLTEIGSRYGEKISGYWFDGWYQSLERYPGLSLEKMWSIVKTGNPHRLVAYNFWVYPVETEWQDYWAAEVGGVVQPAEARYLTSGPGKGLQYQNLIFADAPWVHSKPDSEMEPPRFRDDQLIGFVKDCMAKHGVVTINLGIFQDGSIGPATLRQMQTLRMAIRGK